MNRRAVAVMMLVLVAGCHGRNGVGDTEETAITAAVATRMRSFEAAERSRDAEALIAHFAPVPDFVMYNDGDRVTHAAMSEAVRSTFPNLHAIEGGFDDVRVVVLGSEHALVSARFRETVVDKSGGTTRSRGAASWLWRKVDGQWFIVYGQVDHRPDVGR